MTNDSATDGATEGTTKDATDKALLGAWREGDVAAGRELFSRHYRSVSRFFRNKAPADHEDLTQGTFLACLRHRDTIRDGQRFLPYLLTIARNELYTHIARVNRSPFDPLLTTARAARTGLATRAERAQSSSRLRAALRELPLELQTAIELHYWEDLTTVELATVLGRPQGTIKTRLRRARQLLSNKLEQSDAWLDAQLREHGG